MRWIICLLSALASTSAWYSWKWHDYMDFGSCYLTLSENRLVINEPGGVALYHQTSPEPIGPQWLVLQRPILHVNGHQSYSEGLMLHLDDPDRLERDGVFRTVLTDKGVALCVRDPSKSGGYAMLPVDSLPAELWAVSLDGIDTLHFQLGRQLRAFPAEAPAIAWWAEPLKILISP